MEDMTLRRLLFSKRLFLHGVAHSNKNTVLDRFLAVHHFDNAIELFLKIKATQENIIPTTRQDFTFKDLWSKVNDKLKEKTPSYTLPLRDQIFSLHDTRNLAQHQGDAPSYETLIKYQGYTKDFLSKCFKDIFEIDFDKVYGSILIHDEKVKETLTEAEKYLEQKNFKESMKASAKTFAYIKSKERGSFWSKKLRYFTSFGVLNKHHEISFSSLHSYSFNSIERQIYEKINGDIEKLIGELNKELKERTEKVNEFALAVEEEFAILRLGLDYKEYKVFEKISPPAFFGIDSTEPFVAETKEENYTEENAIFCYEFVLETALRLQSLGNEND